MRNATIRLMLTLTAFLVILQWSRPANADVTITGTVGEIGVMSALSIIRFKLTDATQTATCTDSFQDNNNQPVAGSTAKYAWFFDVPTGTNLADAAAREWFAALLVSKKGAPITCTVVSNTDCHVTGCTLP